MDPLLVVDILKSFQHFKYEIEIELRKFCREMI